MRISHKYKFVFISVPRTASESIRWCLNSYSDIISSDKPPYFHHATARELEIHFERMGWDWDSYFKFAFVRNPWDRLVSQYFFSKPDKNMHYRWDRDKWEKDSLISFTEWIKRCNKIQFSSPTSLSFLHPLDYITDKKGNLAVDFVGKTENLKKDFQKACRKIGIKAKLVHINATRHKHYSTYYTEGTKLIVAKNWKKEIEMFGYEFEHVSRFYNVYWIVKNYLRETGMQMMRRVKFALEKNFPLRDL